MNNILTAKNLILSGVATAGTIITNLLGGWDGNMTALIVAMSLDFGTGLAVATVWKKSAKSLTGGLESKACFKGLIRKMGILAAVLLAIQLDLAMGGKDICKTTVIWFFIGNEGISIVENLSIMGVPFPNVILNALEAMRKKGDNGSSVITTTDSSEKLQDTDGNSQDGENG
ncbi:MAG: phage holin family protein [Selenomonadaceae bacterium]